MGWHSADFSGDGWKDDFEARYPEDNVNTARLKALAEWLVSTDTDQATDEELAEAVTYDGVDYTTDSTEYRLAKFSAELADHFVEDAVIFYYLFTEIFLSIDQREKNAFPTYLADVGKWIVLFYDADSSCGTDNKGNLGFDYYLEDVDYTEGGDPIYNGQNSVLWKNIRATRFDKIAAMYKEMRTNGSISYEKVIEKFENHQSKWPEAIFNEDMYTKCIEPLLDKIKPDKSYLPMLQGKKEQWMKWWLYNRFRYIDSKYETGTSTTNQVMFRARKKANVFLKSYVNMYGRVYYNAAVAEQRMLDRNREYEFIWDASGGEDAVIGINDADMLTSLGDLSPHMVDYIQAANATHITELKVGDDADDYKNPYTKSLSLGNNILLRKLDARNCIALEEAPNASGCTNIEEVYFDGSKITGLILPNGGILKTLHLPETVANLTLLNQTSLTEFVMPSFANVTTLRLENNSKVIDPFAILEQIADNSRVRIIGFDRTMTESELKALLDKLGTMRGLDENGNTIQGEDGNHEGCAQVSGRIYVEEINGATLARAKKYVGLTVEYGSVFLNSTRLVERTLSGEYTNDRVTRVGAYAIEGLTGVTKFTATRATIFGSHDSGGSVAQRIVLPKVMELYGFSYCGTIKVLDTSSVTNINGAIFNGTTVTAFVLRGSTVPTLTSTLAWAKGPEYIYVPCNLVDSYKSATNWSNYADKFRALEDYTVDGTITGELDETKI